MKREILFRGFNECGNGTQEIWTSGTCQGEKVKGKIKGEWLEGCYVYDNNLNHHIRAFDNCYYAVIPETVCQYTGLEDKSGNKIYIGDILQYNDNKYIIRESRLGWRLMYQGDRHSTTMWIHKYEKIGTIFDKEEK